MNIQPEQIDKESADLFVKTFMDAGKLRHIWLGYFLALYEESGSVNLACTEATTKLNDSNYDLADIDQKLDKAMARGMITTGSGLDGPFLDFTNVRSITV